MCTMYTTCRSTKRSSGQDEEEEAYSDKFLFALILAVPIIFMILLYLVSVFTTGGSFAWIEDLNCTQFVGEIWPKLIGPFLLFKDSTSWNKPYLLSTLLSKAKPYLKPVLVGSAAALVTG